MRPILAVILLIFFQTFALAQNNNYSKPSFSYLNSDSVPPAWRQYEVLEEAVENEEFDKPFAVGLNNKRQTIKRKVRKNNYIQVQEYERSIDPNAQRLFEETEIKVEYSTPEVRKVSDAYTGYRVEIVTAAQALPADHVLFFRHGNLYFDQKRNGKYSYMIGAFKTEEEALKFYEELLEQRYPAGVIIEYKNGRRIE